jgi:uncharacterized membrane protein YfcA
MNKPMSITTLIILLAIGLVAGMLSSMVGIGGGMVIVPALVLFMGLDQKMAQGTSLALLMLPLGVLGVMVYHKTGNVKWQYTLLMACTFVIGSYVGAKIVHQLNATAVKRIFAVFMIIMAIKYLFFDKPKTLNTNENKTEQNQ